MQKCCHQSIGILDTHLVIKFQIFHSISVLVINKALCIFSHLSKTGNYDITWRGVKNFNRKLQLQQVEVFG